MSQRLPEVKMVTSLLFRRQYYRELSPSALGRLLDESLTGLRNIRHERWRLPDPLFQEMHDYSYGPIEGVTSSQRGFWDPSYHDH